MRNWSSGWYDIQCRLRLVHAEHSVEQGGIGLLYGGWQSSPPISNRQKPVHGRWHYLKTGRDKVILTLTVWVFVRDMSHWVLFFFIKNCSFTLTFYGTFYSAKCPGSRALQLVASAHQCLLVPRDQWNLHSVCAEASYRRALLSKWEGLVLAGGEGPKGPGGNQSRGRLSPVCALLRHFQFQRVPWKRGAVK